MWKGYIRGNNRQNVCEQSISLRRLIWESRDSTLPPAWKRTRGYEPIANESEDISEREFHQGDWLC